MPKFASTSAESSYLKKIGDLLDAGWKPGRSNLAAAEAHFKGALSLQDGDPRLYYAYALVLRRHLKSNDALEQFELATKQPSLAYFPAWQAIARLHVEKRDYAFGIELLFQLAKQIENSDATWPDQFSKDQSAQWMGRMVGFLKGPIADAAAAGESVASRTTEIRNILNDRHRVFFDNGQQAFLTRYKQLHESSEQLREKTAQQQKEKNEKKKTEIKAQQEEADKKKDELQQTAQQWKTWIDTQLAECDRKLAELEKSYNILAQEEKALSNAIQKSNAVINNLEFQMAQTKGNLLRQYREKFNLETKKRARLQQQYFELALQARKRELNRQAMEVVARRKAANARYQKATGKMVKENKYLQRSDKRLESQRKKTDRKPTGKSARVNHRLSSLRTYIPFDLEAEKQRVLSSYPKGAN